LQRASAAGLSSATTEALLDGWAALEERMLEIAGDGRPLADVERLGLLVVD
jgi:hypothetical protein